MERIRRVDQPTNIITDAVQRIDMRDTAYGLAGRGEYGPVVQKAVQRSLPGKYPLSAAQKDVIDHIAADRAAAGGSGDRTDPARRRDADAPHQGRELLPEGRYRRNLPGARIGLLQPRQAGQPHCPQIWAGGHRRHAQGAGRDGRLIGPRLDGRPHQLSSLPASRDGRRDHRQLYPAPGLGSRAPVRPFVHQPLLGAAAAAAARGRASAR